LDEINDDNLYSLYNFFIQNEVKNEENFKSHKFEYGYYQLKEYIKELYFLSKIKREAYEKKIPIIEDEVGNILRLICFLKKPKYVLEIGCGIGYSTYYIFSGIYLSINSTSLSNSDLQNFNLGISSNKKSKEMSNNFYYYGIDLNNKRLNQAKDFINKQFSKLIDNNFINANFIAGNAIKIINQNNFNCCFDLIFIDGAKFEYPIYLQAIKPILSNKSIIIADNIFYSGKIFKENISKHDYNSVQGIRQYINLILNKDEFKTIFLNIKDGISISLYKK